jgi:parvulin-like peptidyl-prolyl isomerase
MSEKFRKIPRKVNNSSKKEIDFRKKALRAVNAKELINLGLLILLILIVSLTVFTIYINSVEIKITDKTPGILVKALELNKRIFQKDARPAAIVNGESISSLDLEARYSLLPEEYKQLISKESLLSQLIDEKILLQECAKENIVVTDQELSDQIASLLMQSQLTREDLDKSLAGKNLTYADLEDFTRKELLLTKLLNKNVVSKVNVLDTDIKDFYYSNTKEFTIPRSANVSHLLICHNESLRCVSNLTKDQAKKRINDLKLMLNSTNFNFIAFQYSDEPAAKMTYGSLGFVSSEDPFDKTFLNATFSLKTGEVSMPVETVFGFHLIKVIEMKDEEVLKLESVYDQINKTITTSIQKKVFAGYIEGLRNSSIIVNFIENKKK